MKFSEKGGGGAKAFRKFSGNSSVFGETGFPELSEPQTEWRSCFWADCSSQTEWGSTERRRQSPPHTQCAAHHLNTMSPIHLIRHIRVRLTDGEVKRKHLFSWKLLIWSSAHFTWSKFKSIFPNTVFNMLKKMQRVIIIIIISAHIDIMSCCIQEEWW